MAGKLSDERLAEIRSSRLADDVAIELGMFLSSGFAHVAMLHGAVTRAGFVVNGRTQTSMEGYSGRDAYFYGYNPLEGRTALEDKHG